MTSAKRIENVDLRHRDLIGDAAEMERDPVGQRGADAVAHLDMVAMDGDAALRADFDRPSEQSAAGAVILGDAGDAGADQDPVVCPRAFSSARCCQIGCFSSLSRISGVRTETM